MPRFALHLHRIALALPRLALSLSCLGLALSSPALALPYAASSSGRPALARPAQAQTRWSMVVTPTPVRHARPPRRLDGLVDAATQILLAERLARQRVIVIVPCCQRPPVETWTWR